MKQRLERALRAIDSLPDDDWQPEHWDVFVSARMVIADELGRIDRTEARAPRRARVKPGWTLTDAREIVYVRSGGFCEARTPVCSGLAVHVHHRRGKQGHDPHHPDLLLHVCSACHSHIHGNPAEAYRHGWMVKRLVTP